MLYKMFLETKKLVTLVIENLCKQIADIVGNVNPAQSNAELCNLIASTLINCGLKKDQFTH